MTEENSQREGRLAELHDALISDLLATIRDEERTLSNADKRLAFDIIKYHGIQDVRPESPINEVADKLPFDSIDQEVV